MGAAASDFFTPYADIQHGFLDAELAIEDLHELAAKGKYHHVSKRLKYGMDPNGKMFFEDDAYEREDSPMICAARGHLWNKGRKRHLKTLDVLLKFGADVNQCNVLEQTPLLVACDRSLLLIATWLVTHGADVGVSPLLCAYRNQNQDLVRLLLEHGAAALQPPKRFSCIKFPVLVDEAAAAERGNQAVSTSSAATSDSDDDDDGGDNDRIARQRQALEAQAFAQLVALDLHKRVEQQMDVRNKMLQEIEDAARIEDQRVYREQLADQGAKRKQRRREARARANYQQFLAKVERKRLEQLAPLARLPVLDGGNENTSQQPLHRGADAVAAAPELLRWEKAPEVRKSGRPRWVARQVWTVHQHQHQHQESSSSNSGDSASVLLQQCQRLQDALDRAASRRKYLESASKAPRSGTTTPDDLQRHGSA